MGGRRTLRSLFRDPSEGISASTSDVTSSMAQILKNLRPRRSLYGSSPRSWSTGLPLLPDSSTSDVSHSKRMSLRDTSLWRSSTANIERQQTKNFLHEIIL